MNTQALQHVLDWLRTTDLNELSYQNGPDKIHFRFDEPSESESAFPPCSLTPVLSPEVGLFHLSELGKSAQAGKGDEVRAGAVLGLVDTGLSKKKVKAPAAGRIVSAPEDGAPVEYGQPLFFIEPR
ncbi:MAG: hypothetical protein V3S11_04430 [Elusimicrobiota bacterium]